MCFQIQLRKINKQFKVDVRAFPLICIISLKYIFGLGFSNIIDQTKKCKMYMHYTVQYTVHCTIWTRAQSGRRQQRKRISEESEMVTYNNVTEVVRSKCVNH